MADRDHLKSGNRIEQRAIEINCLTDMEWHRPWNMQRREYLDLRLFPKSWVGQSLGRAPRALIMRAKRAAERWPALARMYTQSQGMNS